MKPKRVRRKLTMPGPYAYVFNFTKKRFNTKTITVRGKLDFYIHTIKVLAKSSLTGTVPVRFTFSVAGNKFMNEPMALYLLDSPFPFRLFPEVQAKVGDDITVTLDIPEDEKRTIRIMLMGMRR